VLLYLNIDIRRVIWSLTLDCSPPSLALVILLSWIYWKQEGTFVSSSEKWFIYIHATSWPGFVYILPGQWTVWPRHSLASWAISKTLVSNINTPHLPIFSWLVIVATMSLHLIEFLRRLKLRYKYTSEIKLNIDQRWQERLFILRSGFSKSIEVRHQGGL